ncbi:MAG: GNAT family N-acetyltransferase, partial [Aeromicrobium sp.]
MDSIRTERLLLRPFTPDDADDLYAIFSLSEVARWSGNGEPMAHRDEAVARIESFPLRAGPHPASGVFAMVLAGEERVVGMALLVPIPLSSGGEPQDFEIGWHLNPDVWGRGLATDAGSALVARAWE